MPQKSASSWITTHYDCDKIISSLLCRLEVHYCGLCNSSKVSKDLFFVIVWHSSLWNCSNTKYKWFVGAGCATLVGVLKKYSMRGVISALSTSLLTKKSEIGSVVHRVPPGQLHTYSLSLQVYTLKIFDTVHCTDC